jgi:hypothetical protein
MNSTIKQFQYHGITFIVQAYLKDDFVNICPLQPKNTPIMEQLNAIRIEFKRNSPISHTGKDNDAMKALIAKINVPELKQIVDDLMTVQ